MEIRFLTEIDLFEVSQIHRLAFPDSALTKLGNEIVARYYSWLLMGPHRALCIGGFLGGKLAGFCFAGVFQEAETGFLKKNLAYLLCHLIRNPRLLTLKIIRNRLLYGLRSFHHLLRKKIKRTQKLIPVIEKYGILSIAVNPQYHGRGIGARLMKEAEINASQRKFKSIRLTVHPENINALLFYEKLGWQKVIAPDGIWRGYMIKELTPLCD